MRASLFPLSPSPVAIRKGQRGHKPQRDNVSRRAVPFHEVGCSSQHAPLFGQRLYKHGRHGPSAGLAQSAQVGDGSLLVSVVRWHEVREDRVLLWGMTSKLGRVEAEPSSERLLHEPTRWQQDAVAGAQLVQAISQSPQPVDFALLKLRIGFPLLRPPPSSRCAQILARRTRDHARRLVGRVACPEGGKGRLRQRAQRVDRGRVASGFPWAQRDLVLVKQSNHLARWGRAERRLWPRRRCASLKVRGDHQYQKIGMAAKTTSPTRSFS